MEALEERALLAVTSDANAGLVANLYADVLGRLAAPADSAYWDGQLASGQSVDKVVVGFVKSVEHRQHVVSNLYQQYLGRTTDQAGLDYWVGVLGNGTSEFALLSQIASSDEYFNLQGGNNVSYVSGLYREILHRASTGEPEIAYWTALLESGTTRSSVAQGIMNSDEFLGIGVNQMYRDLLKRDAEAGGQAYWVGRFHQGANTFEIERGLLDSAEYAALAQRQLEPGTPLVLPAANLDPAANLTVEFSDQHGFKLDLPALTSDTNSATVIVPPLIDPATGQFASGTVSVQLLENGQPLATLGARQIVTPPASSFAPGTVILAYLNGALQQLSAVEAQSAGTPFDTPALKADLAAQQTNLSQLAADVQAVMTDPLHSFALGSFAGQPVTLGSAQLAALDQLTLAALDGIRLNPSNPAAAQLAAAAEANPAAATMAALIAGPAAAKASPPDSLNAISAAMLNFSLSIEASALAGTTLAPPLLGTPLAAIIFGGGTIVQALGYSLATSDPIALGQLRSAVERAAQSADGVLGNTTGQAQGTLYDRIIKQRGALLNLQTAGPGEFYFVAPGNLQIVETDTHSEAFFAVGLDKRPAGQVTIHLKNDRPDLGTVTPDTLVWNNDDPWPIPRIVRVTPLKNDLADDHQILRISMDTFILSTNPADSGLKTPFPNQVKITDINDTNASVDASYTGTLNTVDAGTATFQIFLTRQPKADVYVRVDSSDETAGFVYRVGDHFTDPTRGSSVITTFTPANWNQLQTVTIQGTDDVADDAGAFEGVPGDNLDVLYHITLRIAFSDDPTYAAAARHEHLKYVSVTNFESYGGGGGGGGGLFNPHF